MVSSDPHAWLRPIYCQLAAQAAFEQLAPVTKFQRMLEGDDVRRTTLIRRRSFESHSTAWRSKLLAAGWTETETADGTEGSAGKLGTPTGTVLGADTPTLRIRPHSPSPALWLGRIDERWIGWRRGWDSLHRWVSKTKTGF